VNQNQWFIHTETSNDIFTQIQTSDYVTDGEGTNISFIERYEDSRSIEDKLYKVRYVIPKEAGNSRDPVTGFNIQLSSLTGFAKTSDPSATTITLEDNNFKRNHQFIAFMSETTNTTLLVWMVKDTTVTLLLMVLLMHINLPSKIQTQMV
jgi:hypothetical protein